MAVVKIHHGPFPTPMKERLEPRIDKRGDDECWPWTGYVMPNGYGKLTVPKGRSNLAHRLVYEEWVAPIPEGLDIDHLCHGWDFSCAGGESCRHRRCVNPSHLKPASKSTNSRRGAASRALLIRSECKNGHPWIPENIRTRPNGQRECRACDTERNQANNAWRGIHNREKTHCPQGHPYDKENTRIYRGGRRCKACDRDRANAAYRRRTQGGG